MKTTLAGLVGLLASLPIHAQVTEAGEVVVTATRFANADPRTPANISIISKEDIQNTPALSIPDLLKTRAGITISSLYGNQGIDASVDIRGFGDAAISNVLILLDGQRLNTVDSSNIQWAAIPVQALERIEIIRGGGSVLYGDRAAGGVINLIKDKSGQSAASVTASLGSYGYKSLDGYVAGGNGNAYFNTFLHSADSNGWRENTDSNQWSVSGRGRLNWDNNDAFLDYSIYRTANGLPGSINRQTYRTDPRRARTPFDSQEKEGYRLRPGVSIALAETLRFDGEIAVAGEHQHFDNVSFGSTFDRSLHTVSFTPRIRWQHGLGPLRSEIVAGLDYYHGRVASDSSAFASQDAKQISRAVYLQNTISLNSSLDLTLGARSQNMDQQASQNAYPAFFLPAFSGSSDRTRNVYDAGLNYHSGQWGAYAKIGSSFRFANTDELFGFDPFTGNPVFAGDIKPQYGRNKEIGASFKGSDFDARVAIYRTDIQDEIGFDSATFANVNFRPTRHQGIETELGWMLTEQLRSRFSYAYTDAEFRSGPNEGQQLPAVPGSRAMAQLVWDTPGYGTYASQLNYVGTRYASGDFANAFGKQPSYTTLDLRASWDIRPVQITATALNIFDRRYAPSTFLSGGNLFFYPADGRSLYISVSYNFK